ncbi:MAG: hypothetical protein JNK16_12830 [Phycisphaerales bacterium]|nr:hypothetical protein [Phycisphaerales bacterium]
MRSVVLLALPLALITPAAFAQPICGVKNHMRLVNRVGGGTTPELRIDTGWTSILPGTSLDTPGTATDTSAFGTSTGSWLISSTYGRMTFSGSGSATNTPGWGLFLWIDWWIGGEPKAWFRDRYTVTSASLPAGTPVQIQFNGTFSGSTFATDPGAANSASATFSFGGPTGFNFTSPASASLIVTVPVGQSRDVDGRLYCVIQDYRMLGATVYTDVIGANLAAGLTANVLTPGATLSWCSDATYDSCAGDLNNDGQVDDSDFQIFVIAYNILDCADPAMPSGCPADLNADGFVDDADFQGFIVAYNALICP